MSKGWLPFQQIQNVGGYEMNGIDVYKGKSTIAVTLPFGEVTALPDNVCHIESELKNWQGF